MTMHDGLYKDANGNIWRATPYGWRLQNTDHDKRLWRGETKRGESEPVPPLTENR